MGRLLATGWIARTPWERLQHFARYLKAATLRLDKLRADPARDARLAAELASLEQPYRRELATRTRYGATSAELDAAPPLGSGWVDAGARPPACSSASSRDESPAVMPNLPAPHVK